MRSNDEEMQFIDDVQLVPADSWVIGNWSRYIPAVVLEIRGGQIVLDERWRFTATKWQGRVVLFHCEFPYFTVRAVTIRPLESYEVFRTKKFLYC